MSELFAAAVSIAPTRRRRFLWAAWWTAPPSREPFRKPDAYEGGARTREEALREAERVAGRPLVEIEGLWARAWSRVLVGQPAFVQKPVGEAAAADAAHAPRAARASREPSPVSLWQVLGVEPKATVEQIRAAFRQRALVTHPDHGGDPEAFRALHRAYQEALERRARTAQRPRRK